MATLRRCLKRAGKDVYIRGMATKKRAYGTGSLFKRSDGLWVGTVEAGWSTRGTRRRLTVSSKSKQECRGKLRDLQRQLLTEGIPEEGASASMTLKPWCHQWLKMKCEEVRPGTYDAHRSIVNRWIIPLLGRKKLSQLTSMDAAHLVAAAKADGIAPSNIARIHTVFMSIVRDAVRAGYTVPPSVLHARGPGAGKRTRYALSPEQCVAVLSACETPFERSLIGLALLLGLRPSEVRGLLWSNVNIDEGWIDVLWQLQRLPYNVRFDRSSGFRVPADYEVMQLAGATHLVRPKTSSGVRRLPLPGYVAAALRDLASISDLEACHGLVFHTESGRFYRDSAHEQLWKSVCARAGIMCVEQNGSIRPFMLYEARHSVASLLKYLRVPDEVIIQIMGHATIQSTRAYIHVDTRETSAAVAAIESALNMA